MRSMELRKKSTLPTTTATAELGRSPQGKESESKLGVFS